MSSSPSVESVPVIDYRTQEHAPHLLIELGGRISGNSVRRKFSDLPEVLASLPSHFVALVVYKDVLLFTTDAMGPLFYFITHLFDADPGLCVFVDDDTPTHPGLRSFIEQVGLDGQVSFLPTLEEANEQIEAYAFTQK